MEFPERVDYQTAIQNPINAFQDFELKKCRSKLLNNWGIPEGLSGGVATTFQLSNSVIWAVKCFKYDIPILEKRYEILDDFLAKSKCRVFVDTKYQKNGILINGRWFPIIRMPWIEGETLENFIDNNFLDSQRIENLIPEFINMVHILQTLKIAHGDLSHRNIIIKNKKLYLVDYDGIYIPELAHIKPDEYGHKNYQHPARNSPDYYNLEMDRFSSIVIYFGLKIISILPQIWKKYRNEDGIFSQEDFLDPDNSALLSEVASSYQMESLVDRFRGICRLDIDKVPTLNQFIAGNFSYPKITPTEKIRYQEREQYIILNALEADKMLLHIGERVKVIGLLTNCRHGTTKKGQPYIFLNFGERYPNQAFTLVLWKESLEKFNESEMKPENFLSKWISIIGVISSYKNKPQMELEIPSQIKEISENEAKQKLGQKTSSRQMITHVSHRNDTISRRDANILNTLYKHKSHSPPQPKTQLQDQKAKKKDYTQVTHGIIGALILGYICLIFWGFWGLIFGMISGYLIGKNIK